MRSIAYEASSTVPLTATVPDSGSSAASAVRAVPRGGQATFSTLTRSERSARLRGGETVESTIVGAPVASSRAAVITPSRYTTSREVSEIVCVETNGADSPRRTSAMSATVTSPPPRTPSLASYSTASLVSNRPRSGLAGELAGT